MANIKISNLLTDEAILSELGDRIGQCRINAQLTQAQLGEQAGVSKRTIERIESGQSAQMISMIRVFRVLGLLSALDQMISDGGPRPMDLLKLQGKQRQRVFSGRRNKPELEGEWSWDDDL
jgi:transcriptional regulator with XRE-family HTH domain